MATMEGRPINDVPREPAPHHEELTPDESAVINAHNQATVWANTGYWNTEGLQSLTDEGKLRQLKPSETAKAGDFVVDTSKPNYAPQIVYGQDQGNYYDYKNSVKAGSYTIYRQPERDN